MKKRRLSMNDRKPLAQHARRVSWAYKLPWLVFWSLAGMVVLVASFGVPRIIFGF